MNRTNFVAIQEAILDWSEREMRTKQPDYAQDPTQDDTDVLANFKIAGQIELALRPKLDSRPDPAGYALFVYAVKHFIPWARAVLYGQVPKSEPLAGRAADLINYVILGGALASERHGIDLFSKGARGAATEEREDSGAAAEESSRETEKVPPCPVCGCVDAYCAVCLFLCRLLGSNGGKRHEYCGRY